MSDQRLQLSRRAHRWATAVFRSVRANANAVSDGCAALPRDHRLAAAVDISADTRTVRPVCCGYGVTD